MAISELKARDTLVAALRRAGGEATTGELRRELSLHRDTVRKRLQRLIEDGVVEQVSKGRYRLAGSPSLSSETGNELLAILEEDDYDAHITGFDLLVMHAHQFVYQYPHLVYAEPSSLNALAFQLLNREFVVIPAGPGPKPSGPDLSRVVVLRSQPNAEQYGARGHLAPVEKAWVDALRETVRGNLDFSLMELGRILRSLVDARVDLRYLRRYARLLGYLDLVDAALNEGEADDDGLSADALALKAGYST